MVLREIGGGRLSIHTLLPPGASPHTFAARPRDLRAVAAADWLLRVGAGFDDWAATLLRAAEGSPQQTVLLALPGIEPLPRHHRHGERGRGALWDPHCWLDPIRVRDALLPALLDTLLGLDPKGATTYRAGAERFERTLDALHSELERLFGGGAPDFVSLHPAWAYLAARYRLHEVGVVEEVPGEAPSPRRLAALVRESRALRVRRLLIEPQLPAAAARVLAEELDAELQLVDPIGNPAVPERSTYAALLRFNARAIAGGGGPQ